MAHAITPGQVQVQVATTAANRGIDLTRIDAVVTGRIDVQGVLGIDPDVRNGFSSIDVEVDVEGGATQAEIDALIAASTKRSAVFDMLANPTAVDVRSAG